MAKEVVTKEAGNLPAAPMGAWGAENITAEDILIPRLLLMQPMSDFVTEGTCKFLDVIDSLERTKVLANEKIALELVVFGQFKTWRVEHDGEFFRTYPFTADNAAWEYETVQEIEGKEVVVTNIITYNYYVLSAEDIKAGKAFPYVVSFKSSSKNAGKALGAHLMRLSSQNKPSAAQIFKLTSKKETNDKGTFAVFEITPGRATTEEELATTYKWYQQLAKAADKVKIDSDEEEKAAEAKPEPKAKAAKGSRAVNDLTV